MEMWESKNWSKRLSQVNSMCAVVTDDFAISAMLERSIFYRGEVSADGAKRLKRICYETIRQDKTTTRVTKFTKL